MNDGNGDNKPKINPEWMDHLQKGGKEFKSKTKKECDKKSSSKGNKEK